MQLSADDSVAKLLFRHFTISTPKWKMDHSPIELKYEIDHLSRDVAVGYLLMPEPVKKLEEQLLSARTECLNVMKNKC